MAIDTDFEYVGFWARVGASLIDTVLMLFVTMPLLMWVYGEAYFNGEFDGFVAGPADLVISWVFPAVATVVFWLYRSATPGKMLIGAKVVNARTGAPPHFNQAVVRYLGYYVAVLPLALGFFWVGFDARKQGWHDKLAGTVVVRPRRRGSLDATFDEPTRP